MIVLRGERVTLRPFRAGEFELLLAGRRRLGGEETVLPPKHVRSSAVRRQQRRRFERSGEFHQGFLDLALEAEGRLVGEIDARRPKRGLPPGVFELGIALFDAADRGKGYGTEAIRLLTDHLFREHGAGRVQASTALDNAAMQRVFERLGFTREGVLRGFMPVEGGRADYVLYGITRADWHEQES